MFERLRQRLQKWGRLSWDERWLFFQASFLLMVITVALRFFDFKRVYYGLQRPFPTPSPKLNNNQQLQQAVNTAAILQNAVYVLPINITCLPQSLALWSLLRHQSIGSDLQIGVQQIEGAFSAHAWVEFEGIVLNDRGDVRERFVALDDLSITDRMHPI